LERKPLLEIPQMVTEELLLLLVLKLLMVPILQLKTLENKLPLVPQMVSEELLLLLVLKLLMELILQPKTLENKLPLLVMFTGLSKLFFNQKKFTINFEKH
jgi:hypothetical protein